MLNIVYVVRLYTYKYQSLGDSQCDVEVGAVSHNGWGEDGEE